MPLATRNKFDDQAFINFDNYVEFDGVDDQIDIPVNNDYVFQMDGISISAFLKPKRFDALGNDIYNLAAANFNTHIVAFENPNVSGEYWYFAIYRISENTYKGFITISLEGSFVSQIFFPVSTEEVAKFNVWTHIFFRLGVNGVSSSTLYINGVKYSFGTVNASASGKSFSGTSFSIGKGNFTTRHYAGGIRDLAFFNIPDSTIITDAVVNKFITYGCAVPEELHPYCFAHFPLDKITLR